MVTLISNKKTNYLGLTNKKIMMNSNDSLIILIVFLIALSFPNLR